MPAFVSTVVSLPEARRDEAVHEVSISTCYRRGRAVRLGTRALVLAGGAGFFVYKTLGALSDMS